ncbi:MAG: MaoC family dehydratase N-terminal domain-containing protein [Dehalococcoidia bacterium]
MAEEEQSLITDEHRALIGVPGEPSTVVVREADAKRMRDVLGDSDPRWADGTGMAPPYVIAFFGGRGGGGRATPQLLPGAILTQQEWKFSRPFKIGEELKAVGQVFDIRERLGGRYGHSVLVTTSTDYYDAAGQHVAASLLTITQFDPARAGRGGSE